nr:MAG TPA: hypothetical protein [Caudoviricetes sp.]
MSQKTCTKQIALGKALKGLRTCLYSSCETINHNIPISSWYRR